MQPIVHPLVVLVATCRRQAAKRSTGESCMYTALHWGSHRVTRIRCHGDGHGRDLHHQ